MSKWGPLYVLVAHGLGANGFSCCVRDCFLFLRILFIMLFVYICYGVTLFFYWIYQFCEFGTLFLVLRFEYRDSNFGEKITSSYTIFPFNRLADKHEWWENLRDQSAMDKDAMDEVQVLNLFLIRCFVSLYAY